MMYRIVFKRRTVLRGASARHLSRLASHPVRITQPVYSFPEFTLAYEVISRSYLANYRTFQAETVFLAAKLWQMRRLSLSFLFHAQKNRSAEVN